MGNGNFICITDYFILYEEGLKDGKRKEVISYKWEVGSR